jgi:hypothetical protein
MRTHALRLIAATFVITLAGVASFTDPARAETLSALTSDHRTYLYFQVPEATVQRVLPNGWQAAPPQSGPAQGANLLVILIDQMMAQDAQARPIAGGTNQFAVLGVPVRSAATGAGGLMVFDGFAAKAEGAPGAYGVYEPAEMRLERSVQAGPADARRGEERWSVESRAGGGNRLEMRLRYTAATPNRVASETRVYAARNPDFHRIYRVEQGNDFLRSGPAGTGRVDEFTFTASGTRLAPLFDGQERLVAILSVPSYMRQIFLP